MKNERRSILKAKKEILRVKAKRVEHLEKKLARKMAALNKAKAEGKVKKIRKLQASIDKLQKRITVYKKEVQAHKKDVKKTEARHKAIAKKEAKREAKFLKSQELRKQQAIKKATESDLHHYHPVQYETKLTPEEIKQRVAKVEAASKER